MRWWRGRWGLGGASSTEAPLYRSETLAADPAGPVYLVEGERAADAVARAGALAVGTVCGASAVPARAVLEVLRGRRVILWPDADPIGAEHMDRVAARLSGVVSELRRVDLGDRPSGWDAADELAAGGGL
jgi:DNA primase